MNKATAIQHLLDRHSHLSEEHEKFNSKGQPAFAREIRFRLEAIETALVNICTEDQPSAATTEGEGLVCQ